MTRFAFSAYADTGRLVKGDIEAESDSSALDLLVQRGLTPVSVTAGNASAPWWAREIRFTSQSKALKPSELEVIFTSLSAMLSAKFPLLKSLAFCKEQNRSPKARQLLLRIQEDVSNGESLAAAMRHSGGVIPERIIALIELGETSNSLPDVVRRIAQTLSDETSLRRELRSALIYPVILLIMSALVITLIVFYLVPTLTPVFASAGADLPRLLAGLSYFRVMLLSHWPVMLLTIPIAIGVLMAIQRSEHKYVNRLISHTPLLGTYLRQRHSLQVCETLYAMLASGAPITQALQVTAQHGPTPALRALFRRTNDRVVAGETLSNALAKSSLLDPMAVALLGAGEETDQLKDVLATICTDLRMRTKRTVKQAMQMLTPILTLIIGLAVGGLILSTITAIMDLNDIAF